VKLDKARKSVKGESTEDGSFFLLKIGGQSLALSVTFFKQRRAAIDTQWH
jgi:hypothetical protein